MAKGEQSAGSVLVTGGAGYVGSHTVRALRAAGRDVVVLDSLEHGNVDAVLGAPLVVGDVADRDLVASTCHDHGVTQLVHFAAYKAVGESMAKPGIYWRNNVAGSIELFDAVHAAGVAQVVFSSSCSVHGNPDDMPVNESHSIRPESVYAETKAMVERVLHWYSQTTDMKSISLRYFNAAGASFDGAIGEDWDHTFSLIPLAMKALLGDGQRLKVFGDDYDTPDGTCIRDYVHVEDLARAHVQALDHLERGGESTALNIGTGVGSSVMEVLGLASEIAGREVPHDIAARRSGDPAAIFADPEQARILLGWTAEHGLRDIMKTAYDWHAAHTDR